MTVLDFVVGVYLLREYDIIPTTADNESLSFFCRIS